MDKVFRVYVANGDDSGQEVDLPATDHRMLDLMDKLRLAPGELPYLEMLRYGEFEYLQKCMSDQCSLYELNGLAGRLAKLGPQELAAFEGFVGMELQKEKMRSRSPSSLISRIVPTAATCCRTL